MYAPSSQHSPRSRGITLMELVIYLALLGLIGTAVVRFTLGVSNARNKNYAVQTVQNHGRTMLELVSARIRRATSVNTASSTFDVHPGVLTLNMAESAVHPTVIDLTEDQGRLRITEGTNAPLIVSPETLTITNLTFTNLTSTSLRENIRVVFTVGYDNDSGDVHFNADQTFQTSVSVRQ